MHVGSIIFRGREPALARGSRGIRFSRTRLTHPLAIFCTYSVIQNVHPLCGPHGLNSDCATNKRHEDNMSCEKIEVRSLSILIMRISVNFPPRQEDERRKAFDF